MLGLEPTQIECYTKEIANLSNNPQKLDPPYLLFPREEFVEGKSILVVQVPLSSQLHRHKGEVYLRSDEGDYRIKGTHQLAGLMNRKLGIFTEQTPMTEFTRDDLRPDLFEKARSLMRRRSQNHPWLDLDMDMLLRTAGLYAPEKASSRTLTLAAILIFGTDAAIRRAVPAYTFDCLLRRRIPDRYDDRLMIDTNLIDAYDLMMGFVEKHLDDPFYLEGGVTVSLRERIFREAISNIISHREYRDATPARFMIYKDQIILDNPAMPYFHTRITPQNLRSHPKNPAICKFMIQIGRFDQLGSGVLNIHKYWPVFAPGTEPVFRETRHGFELILPLQKTVDAAQATPEVIPEASRLLPLCASPKSRHELQVALGLKDDDYIRVAYLNQALNTGLIERTIPDKPNSPRQKYRLTEKGRLAAKKMKEQP